MRNIAQKVAPDPRPHDASTGRCLPSCCKNPYMCRNQYRCGCHTKQKT